MKKRSNGILMHISALPGPYGIGDLGKGAYDFADFLKSTKTQYWQILPLGITGYGDSPYQSFSAFAGNPYFIDLDELVKDGYLHQDEIQSADLGDDPGKVNYAKLYENKMPLLRSAYDKARHKISRRLESFLKQEAAWLDDFALFMAIKSVRAGESWQKWPKALKERDQTVLAEFKESHEEEIYFWVFTQYYFFKQWEKLKKHVNSLGIKIIGDIPIYVAEDGADVWSNPKLFVLNRQLAPTAVAGCPPDAFTADGQLWGNPLYDWQAMKQTDYKWWIKRIEESFRIYDTVRIDHFRGFESYWVIPAGATTAVDGKWVKGPGLELFDKVKEKLGDLDIMAENLGFLTPEVEDLINDTGFPGMNVMVFGFDAREDSDYLPHNYIKNSVVYTTNHDTQTMMGYFKTAPKSEVHYARQYLRLSEKEGLNWGVIRGAWASTSYLAVAPVQDLLGLDDRARFNVPSTLGDNWTWRMNEGALTDEIRHKLLELTKIYRRNDGLDKNPGTGA